MSSTKIFTFKPKPRPPVDTVVTDAAEPELKPSTVFDRLGSPEVKAKEETTAAALAADMQKLTAADEVTDTADVKKNGKSTFHETITDQVIVHLADRTAAVMLAASTFEELNMPADVLKGVYAQGFLKPSKIQARAIPLLLSQPYRNFIGQSQSGTGKSAAFVLSILARVDLSLKTAQAIVLAPTRELANQILTVVDAMTRFTEIKSTLALKEGIHGVGKSSEPITEHIIIGTPGTVQDLLRRKKIDPSHIKMFVIDEADVMLDMQGLGDQTIRIKRFLPEDCQLILFSATYKDAVHEFAERVVPNANMISLKREELSVDAIKQLYLDCADAHKKYETLVAVYGLCNVGQSIIFVHRRDTADSIAQRMQQDGHQMAVIHAGLDATTRDQVFNSYRDGVTKVLITTNVMARGIDVLDVNLVINYDLPLDVDGRPDFDTYLHRIGRTGRFGRKGISINFVWDQKSMADMKEIENYYGRKITRIATDDLMTLETELKAALKGR